MDDNKLEGKLDKIQDHVSEIKEHISEIKIVLGKQHVSLENHIRRTEILETKLEPVERHVQAVTGILKFIGLICMITGCLAAIAKVFS